jgi:DNA-binding NtrC family response regulator
MALFQRRRRLLGKTTHQPTANEFETMQLDAAEEVIIRQRIKRMRPETPWHEIADSLGISDKTLLVKRKQYGLPT